MLINFYPPQVGFVVMSGMMIYTMYEYWPLNSALCTIWQVFDFAMCSVSMLHLCLIAFDRLVYRVIPYKQISHQVDLLGISLVHK